MKIIGFGQLSYYLFFPLFTPIFSSIFVTITQTFIANADKTNTLYKHPLVATFFLFISQILVGVLELISKRLQRHKSKMHPKQETVQYQTVFYLEVIKSDGLPKEKILFFVLFGLAVVETVAMTIGCCLSYANREILISQLIALQMVFSGIFSYPILHYKIFKHQFIALGFFLFGIAAISWKAIGSSFGFEVLAIMCGIVLWSFQSVIAKWLMETKLISQFKYLFLHGLIGASLLAVVLIISPYIPCTAIFCSGGYLENTWDTLSWMFVKDYIFNLIGLILICSVYNTFQLTTIKLFNPTHNDASESLGSLISWIFLAYIAEGKTTNEFVLSFQIVGYIFMFLGSLMYNEIIIVYLFNLSYYTKLEIKKRSEEEHEAVNMDISLIDVNPDSEKVKDYLHESGLLEHF